MTRKPKIAYFSMEIGLHPDMPTYAGALGVLAGDTLRAAAGGRADNFSLRYALSIPDDEVWAAHRRAKQDLVGYVNREANAGLDVDVLTIGFARRATAYKRADLIFDDIDRLRADCP